MSDVGAQLAEREPDGPAGRPDEPRTRIAARLLISLGVSAAVGLLLFLGVPRTFQGRSDIVGYPLYADFNVNRYLDAGDLIGAFFPLCSFLLYLLLARVGPLRRLTPPRRAAVSGPVPDLLAPLGAPVRPWLGAILRSGAIGGTLAFGAVACLGLGSTASVLVLVLGTLAFTTATAVLGTFAFAADRVGGVSRVNSWSCVAVAPLLGWCGAVTQVRVGTSAIVHYDWFPWPVAVVATLLLGALVWHRTHRTDAHRLEHQLLLGLVGPVLIFFCFMALPGELGKMDAFTEGEYLAGGWLMLHGALPWRDLYQIHGVLDDGLKAILGFEVFGPSRWGATSGITMFFHPAYWVSYYLLAARLFRERAGLLVAGLVAILGGVLIDWDVRYLLWPLVLLALGWLIRSPGWPSAAVFSLAAIGQAILVPELLLALPPTFVVVLLVDVVERRARRLHWSDLVRTRPALVCSAALGVAFGLFLLGSGGASGFVGYFEDFATGHATTGGVPLFTDYALTPERTGLGVYRYRSSTPPVLGRYSIELWLPMLLALVVLALVVSGIRRGRRLSVEHWLGLASAGMVLLYFQKGLSRADDSHIGEVFSVSVPLVFCSAALLAGWIERCRERPPWERRSLVAFLDRFRALPGALPSPRVTGLVVVVVLLGLAPVSLNQLLSGTRVALRASAASPGPAAVAPGAPTLGYEADALPNGLVTGLSTLLARYEPASGTLFDFSDAPGLSDFLLDRRPGTRFYDISLALTPGAQRSVVSDLEASHPPLVLWSGPVGLPSWDFIPNEIREYLVSAYVLSHYRPLASLDGALVLIADDDPQAPSASVSQRLDFAEPPCAFGDIPSFLTPAETTGPATSAPVRQIADLGGRGRIYEVDVPAGYSKSYGAIELTRSSASRAGSLTLTNVLRKGDRDTPWHDIRWVDTVGTASTQVPVDSCLQWQGYGDRLFVRYEGPGTVTAVRLLAR